MDSKNEMLRVIRDVYGLRNREVLKVMGTIPRERFVDRKYYSLAYDDRAIPIGHGQTISQPYTVAFMTNLLLTSVKRRYRNKVLEIGTGSGYQAAILSKLFDQVYSIEIIPELARRARSVLERLDLVNIKVKSGNGEMGWKKHSPYDAIIISANIQKNVPKILFAQLAKGGVLVTPLKGMMMRYKKDKGNRLIGKSFGRFDFVPFIQTSYK